MGEESVAQLYNLIRDLTAQMTNQYNQLSQKLTEVYVTLKEKEKRCEDHGEQMSDHNKRIKDLELWQAGQQGVAGAIHRWGPVAISTVIGIYVAIS